MPWGSVKSKALLAALVWRDWRIVRRRSGSHIVLARPGWPEFVFAFHAGDEIGPKMLARIAKLTGLRPEDL